MLIIWVTFDISFYNALTFIIDIPLSALISGFVTSLLISKDEIPPSIPFFFKEDDSTKGRRIGSGIFSSVVFILIFFTQFFLIMLLSSGFENKIFYAVGFYLIGCLSYFFLGLFMGGLGGKAGVAVRDSF